MAYHVTFSKSIVETLKKGVKYVRSCQEKHQNDFIDFINFEHISHLFLVLLLLTFNK